MIRAVRESVPAMAFHRLDFCEQLLIVTELEEKASVALGTLHRQSEFPRFKHQFLNHRILVSLDFDREGTVSDLLGLSIPDSTQTGPLKE